MKTTLSKKLICSIISLQFVLGSYPLASFADKTEPETITAPGAFIDAVQNESDDLFGKNGCASIDDKGNVTIKFNETTQAEIQEGGKSKGSLNCKARVEALIPKVKKVIEMQKEASKISSKSKSNQDCAECHNPLLDSMVLPEASCSNNEKKKIELEEKTNPSCTVGCNAKSAWNAAKNAHPVLLGLVPKFESTKSCQIDSKPKTSFGSCLMDLLSSLGSSLKEMGKAVFSAVKSGFSSAGKWIAGLFSSNKKVETAASDSALIKSGLSDQEIEAAQKNARHATYEKLSGFQKFMDNLGEYALNLETGKYRELFACAKCNEKMSALCKVIGVIGKDVVKNALIVYLTGGTFKILAKTPVGKKLIGWGEKRAAVFTEKHASKISKFTSHPVGKGLTLLAAGTGKILVGLNNVADYPTKILIKGGKNVANRLTTAASRDALFAATPELANKASKNLEPALSSLDEVTTSNIPLKVEVPRPITQEMQKSINSIKRMKSAGKTNLSGIEQATEVPYEVVNTHSVKINTSEGERYIRLPNTHRSGIQNASSVDVSDKKFNFQILSYNNGKNNLIIAPGKSDVLFIQEGKISGRIPAKEVDRSGIKALTGAEEAKADQLAVQQTKANAEANGVLLEKEVNASSKEATEQFKVNTGKECGNQTVSIEAFKGGLAQ